ncbi:hypothetical protein [Prevotella disiens]|jgi:hypothetical protein|uniref:Phospholipase n=4 Tax=Prevotella disiens TaxID=28130 RepID=A0A379DZB8_9BACT|nr:hypothetical protein [Prevotella disiens]EFL46933.1 hypothetical protein HMPREF9296_2488 [Prevotella disiens FB035-09AN]ERJ77400.1 hypothetical protein HMPREF0653_01130 [Prevotella disiens JCM 6334 = ATCC 29426]KGF50428.1 hypothetical protein HMPREF0654_01785 [Prevotella disiens DNF00882]RGL06774.1 hypothetical protein DXC89_00135 [Prevotella disiens]SUB85823.1 Uncharacterised protein [Prevotella disiens]
MDIIIIGLLAILGMGALVGIATLLNRQKGEEDVINHASGDCSTCIGIDESCEQTCTMEAATKPIEYYDDEELDRFKGREATEYTDKEAEEFSEILYTMCPEEAKGWNRSLILRGINVPNQIKDELIAMIEG